MIEEQASMTLKPITVFAPHNNSLSTSSQPRQLIINKLKLQIMRPFSNDTRPRFTSSVHDKE
tara:strand:+ start:567 stop:752 length:186 start_codon:yes stop_codon:yes gene_type:complete